MQTRCDKCFQVGGSIWVLKANIDILILMCAAEKGNPAQEMQLNCGNDSQMKTYQESAAGVQSQDDKGLNKKSRDTLDNIINQVSSTGRK